MSQPRRLAIVATHPIQHFVHLYRALSKCEGVVLKVFFCSRIGLEKYFDREMQTEIAWADDLVGGYDHVFLPDGAGIDRSTFWTMNNPSVIGALKAFEPNAVMVYGYATATALRVLAWARFEGVPILMTGDGELGRPRSLLKSLVRAAAVRSIFSQVSAFLTVGDQNERMLAAAGVGRNRMFRSPFTIDEAAYRRAAAQRAELRGRIRAEFNLPEPAFVALFVGKLSVRKRPKDLLEAWLALRDQGREAALHILYCGNGAERASLEGFAKEHAIPATFAGFVNVDRLPGFYCAADVLVHPSEHDPHPLICSEAAAIGLPMILSDRVGAVGETDLARAGVNAIVFPCGDIGALAAAIGGIETDPERQAEMSASSRRIYDECDLAASTGGVLRAVEFVTAGRKRAVDAAPHTQRT